MPERFLATVEGGIARLKAKKIRLEAKLDQIHVCNCEFCSQRGGKVRSRRVQKSIEEVDREVAILERYLRDWLK
jgi:hypothetical protein